MDHPTVATIAQYVLRNGTRRIRVAKHELAPCDCCGLHATLRSLDVHVPAIAARPRGGKFLPARAAVPEGWAPLIALCGNCWTDVRTMLREAATPDASGVISPP